MPRLARPAIGPTPAAVGLGLKRQHLPQILDGECVDLDLFEIHAENYLDVGGPLMRGLERVCERHRLSVHGVGLSLAGTDRPDRAHLAALRRLLDRVQPALFSEHLAWSGHAGVAYPDLLPIPYDAASLARVCRHIDEVQEALGRPMLLENPSTYLGFAQSTLDEAQFLAAIVARTGCSLLLDVNNLYVSAVNHGREARDALDALPLHAVGEIHLAGHAVDRDAAGDPLLIDNHGAPVADAVWALYRAVVERTGPVTTVIERDQHIPDFATLLGEAHAARALQREATRPLTAEVA